MNKGSRPAPYQRIYGVVLSVGVVCSLAIVSVYQITQPMIRSNRVALRQRAILEVLPAAANIKTYQLDHQSEQLQITASDVDGSDLVFAGFDLDGNLVGLAIEAAGMGYQDVIRLLYGYSPADKAIIGIRVLESRETPGLGDRIETDADFLSNFVNLDVALDAAGTALANPIEFVKSGTKTHPWQVDGITGATISSRATAEMLRDSAAYWLPRIESRLADFTPANPEAK